MSSPARAASSFITAAGWLNSATAGWCAGIARLEQFVLCSACYRLGERGPGLPWGTSSVWVRSNAASCSAWRTLKTQYGVGSAGSVSVTRNTGPTHPVCSTNAAGSRSGPSTRRLASGGITWTGPSWRTGTCAGPTRSSSPCRATRCRPIRHSTTQVSGTVNRYGSQARTPGYPIWTSAASSVATPKASGHHHSGTARRSSKTAASDECWPGASRSDTRLRVVSRAVSPPPLEVLLTRLDPEVPVPEYAHIGDARADLVTTRDVVLPPGERTVVGTGIAIALPSGYAAFVHPRSGLAAQAGLAVINSPGTIDAGYRGELRVCLVNHDLREPAVLRRMDRIAQLVVQRVERAAFREVTALPQSLRGTNGYGSTGTCQLGGTTQQGE